MMLAHFRSNPLWSPWCLRVAPGCISGVSWVSPGCLLGVPWEHSWVLLYVLYSTLSYSTLLYSTLLCSILLYSTLLCSTILCSTVIYPIQCFCLAVCLSSCLPGCLGLPLSVLPTTGVRPRSWQLLYKTIGFYYNNAPVSATKLLTDTLKTCVSLLWNQCATQWAQYV